MATLYDVAKLAGVSTATVSRVLHGQDRVKLATRERVQLAIDQLGYVPDGAAQSLSRRRKDVIGLICIERPTHSQDVENTNFTYTDELLRGVEGRIRDLDWSLLIRFWNGATDPAFPRLPTLSGKVDGILISEGSFPARLLDRLVHKVPVVVIAGSPRQRELDVVTADNKSGSAALVEHLIDVHGARRLFHLDGPAEAPDAVERRIGLDQVLGANRKVQLVGSLHGSFSVESGLEAGHRILDDWRHDLPDAIVCGNDQMAIGLLRTLNQAGVRVPHDVALVGFDDVFPDKLYDPPLTTVYQPMRVLGERACIRLLDRIADPSLKPAVQILPTELVVRESCGCPPGTLIRQPIETRE